MSVVRAPVASSSSRMVAGTVGKGGVRAALEGRTDTILAPTIVLPSGARRAQGLNNEGPERSSVRIILSGTSRLHVKAASWLAMARLGVRCSDTFFSSTIRSMTPLCRDDVECLPNLER